MNVSKRKYLLRCFIGVTVRCCYRYKSNKKVCDLNPNFRVKMMLKQLNIEDAIELLKNDSALLFDIRDEESYAQSHAQGAVHLTYEMLIDFISSADKHSTIIVMCYHGISSLQVSQMFVDEGFENVSSVEGGYEAWKQYKHRAEE